MRRSGRNALSTLFRQMNAGNGKCLNVFIHANLNLQEIRYNQWMNETNQQNQVKTTPPLFPAYY